MTRDAVRLLKRTLQVASRPEAGAGGQLLARECALSLLARSISFGHGRLAVIRLGLAVRTGAEVPAEHWDYCRAAAAASRDGEVLAMFEAAQAEAEAKAAPAAPRHAAPRAADREAAWATA